MAIDSRLFMEIGFVGTAFQAIDNTPYSRWIQDGILDNDHEHLVLQRIINVTDGEDNKQIDFRLRVATTAEELADPYEKDGLTNGLYYYQKVLIPSEAHVTTANERLYFDSDHIIHYIDIDEGINETYDAQTDFDEIYDILRKEYPDNCFYFDDYSFTIYDLIECYVLTERDRINNYLKNSCNGNCEKGHSDLDARADILLAAIMVIKDLMEKGDYFEAQRILNGLHTCGNLCKKYIKNLKGCGCGGS